MKKLLLSLGVAILSVTSYAQVQRTVLIEEFTQASCGPCASQNPAFNTLLANNPTKVVQIKYQTSWPGTDPMNAQNPTEVATRVSKYNVSGVPFSVIDGDTLKNPATSTAYAGAPANITQTMIDNEYAITSPLTITATYNYNAVTDSITSVITVTNVSTAAINASAATQLKLMVALVEMNINFATAPGTNGETDFYYVMRKMYPSAGGNQLPDILVPNTPYTFTIKEKAPTYIYKKAQMAVVTFVQDLGTNKVYQAKLALPPNTIDAKAEYTGTTTSTNYCGATVNPIVKITNVGTTTLTSATVSYTINGAAGSSQNWTGSLATGQSANVTMPAITAPVGNTAYKFSISNVNTNAVDINDANNIMNSVITKVVGNVTATPFSETFEASAIGSSATAQSLCNLVGGSYVVDKTISTSLTQKLGAYGLSDKSYRYRFYNVPAGNRLGLVFYKNNVSGKGYGNISFDYAYNFYSATDGTAYDTLAVKVSTDCGATWTEVWKKAGTALQTSAAAGAAAAYYPATSEWKSDYAVLNTPFNNATELLVMFEGQSGFGNNLYIDNINFWYPTGVEEVNATSAVTVYPNPATSTLNIKGIKGNAELSISDVLGRTLLSAKYEGVNDEIKVDVSKIAKGNYILKIANEGNTVSKSITIKE